MWGDPATGAYTWWQQRKLAGEYEQTVDRYRPAPTSPPRTSPRASSATDAPRDLRRLARRFRLESERGDPIGRIRIQRLGLSMLVVNGTDAGPLSEAPGVTSGRSCPARGSSSTSLGTGRRGGALRSHRQPAKRGQSRSGDAVRPVRLPRVVVRDRAGGRHATAAVGGAGGTRPTGLPPAVLRTRAVHRLRNPSERGACSHKLRSCRLSPVRSEGSLEAVANVAHVHVHRDEQISPELVLVDPELARRVRPFAVAGPAIAFRSPELAPVRRAPPQPAVTLPAPAAAPLEPVVPLPAPAAAPQKPWCRRPRLPPRRGSLWCRCPRPPRRPRSLPRRHLRRPFVRPGRFRLGGHPRRPQSRYLHRFRRLVPGGLCWCAPCRRSLPSQSWVCVPAAPGRSQSRAGATSWRKTPE